MAVTNAQINAGEAAILERVFRDYPQSRDAIKRVAVRLAKGGTPAQREVLQVILQRAYKAETTREPLGQFAHNFKQWLREALQDPSGVDPTTGVDMGDAVDPVDVVVV